MRGTKMMGWMWMFCSGLLLCVASEANGSERLWIQGDVAFEKRSTSVPMLLCEFDCPDSQPYWALVIQAEGGKKYELDQLFALGQSKRPEFIELDGIPVRPGSRLILDVTADSVARNYAVIQEIHSWDYRMDLKGIPGIEDDPIWRCRSVDRANPLNEVQVYRKSQDPRVGDYEIHWVKISNQNPSDESQKTVVARVSHVDVEVTPEDAVFYGANLYEEALLDLDLTQQALRNVPGRFTYTRYVEGEPETVAFETTCRMRLILH